MAIRTAAARRKIPRTISHFPLRRRPGFDRIEPGLEPGPRGNREARSRLQVLLQVLEVAGQGMGVRVAVLAVLPQASRDDLMHLRRQAPADRGHGPRFLVSDGVHGIERRIALERQLAGRHFIEDDAQGEDIAPRVEAPAPRLLGAHVAQRSQDRAGNGLGLFHGQGPGRRRSGGVASLGARIHQLGQPEVQDLGVAVARDHDIIRLDIPVDDARAVRPGQAFGDLKPDLHGPHEVELALRDELADRPAVDVFHGDKSDPVGFVDVVDRGDRRMIDGRGRPGLEDEPLPPFGVGDEVGLDDLEGDRALQPGVEGAVDFSHAAPAQERVDPVVLERPSDHRGSAETSYFITQVPAGVKPAAGASIRTERRVSGR